MTAAGPRTDQLPLLLEIQDLRAKRRELSTPEGAAPLEALHFGIDAAEACLKLEGKITELEGALTSKVRQRYRKLIPQRDRVIVPVIDGICYGCFVSVPTSTVRGDESGEPPTCENCGRFLYLPS